jgi:Zn-dependent protease
VAIAGPASNILLATVLALAYHLLPVENSPILEFFLILGIQLNIVFAVFNLIPIPPLDGSRVVYATLKSPQAVNAYRNFSQFGIFILIGLLFFGGIDLIINPMLDFFFKLFRLS